MLTMINGEYYLCMWNRWIRGQKKGMEFAVNAKIIGGVFWNNFIATRKTFATLVCETVWTNYTSDRWVGVYINEDILGGLTLHVKRVDSEAEKKARNLLRSNRPSITHKTSTLTTGANIYLQQRWWDGDADVVDDNGVLKRFTLLFRGAKMDTGKFANMHIGKSKNF